MTNKPAMRKFLFNRSFENGREAEAVPVFSEEQVEAARREGYEEGFRDGEATTMEEQQRQFKALVQSLEQQVSTLLTEIVERKKRQQAEVSEISFGIIRKTIPVYIAKNGIDEIQNLIENIMRDLSHEPRFVIRVSPDLVEDVNELVADITRNLAFDGEVVVVDGEELGPSDCRIEWSDGGIERNMDLFWQELDQVFEKITGKTTNAAEVMKQEVEKIAATSPETDNAE